MSKRLCRSAVAVLLVFCVFVGMMPTEAFAARSARTINYVSLGDSMTNGYGLPDNLENGFEVNGFRQNDITTTYPALIRDSILGRSFVDAVNWEQLAINGMRPEDINFLLRFKTENTKWSNTAAVLTNCHTSLSWWNETQDGLNGKTTKEAWNSTFKEGDVVLGDQITFSDFVADRFEDWRDAGHVDETGYPWASNPTVAYAKYYQNSIKDADVISLAAGNATFCMTLARGILGSLGALGFEKSHEFPVKEMVLSRLPKTYRKTAGKTIDSINKSVAKKLNKSLSKDEMSSVGTDILEAIEYTVSSYIVSYWDMLTAIDKLHESGNKARKNLDLIEVGLMNPFGNFKIKIDKKTSINLGIIMDIVDDLLSDYYYDMSIQRQNKRSEFKNITFYMAPVSGSFSIISSDMADLEKIKSNTEFREKLASSIEDEIFSLVKDVVEGAMPKSGEEPILHVTSLGEDGQKVGNITAYESMKESYESWKTGGYKIACPVNMNSDLVFSTALYSVFEQVMAANAKRNVFDLSGLMELMEGSGDLSKVFKPVLDALGAETINQLSASAEAAIIASGTQDAATQNKIMAAEISMGLEKILLKALSSKDAESIGSIMSVFAIAIASNGIGAHPNVNGHKSIYRSIAAIYPNYPAESIRTVNKIKAAKMFSNFVLEYGDDAAKYMVNAAKGFIGLSNEQVEMINAAIDDLTTAVFSCEDEEIKEASITLSNMLFNIAKEKGLMPEKYVSLITSSVKAYEKLIKAREIRRKVRFDILKMIFK